MGRRRTKRTRGIKRKCPCCGNNRALVHDTDPQYYPTALKCRSCGHVYKV